MEHEGILDIDNIRSKRNEATFLMRTVTKWNTRPASIFQCAYDPNILKTGINPNQCIFLF